MQKCKKYRIDRIKLFASLQDPFEAYQARLQARLARQDQSDAAVKRRAEAQKEREKDRTTWLGTKLGDKGAAGKLGKRQMEGEDVGGVGKYLKVGGAVGARAGMDVVEYGAEKKKKKTGGGFGDFSGW